MPGACKGSADGGFGAEHVGFQTSGLLGHSAPEVDA